MSKINAYVIKPGDTLLEMLETNNMTQLDLSLKTGLTTKTINEIIKGKAKISQETALKLEYVFDIKASFWNKIESNYQEKLLKQEEQQQIEKEIECLKEIPYNEIAKRNWVAKTRDNIDRVVNMRKFFSVASLLFQTELNHKILFRKSTGKNFCKKSLYCWIRYGEQQTIKENIEIFDVEKIKETSNNLRKYLDKPFFESYNEIKNELLKCGISLVYEPCLPNTYVNGISYKITDDVALIMISGRNKREDSLWFTLFHELGHLIKHSKKEVYIDIDDQEETEIEKEANEYAKNMIMDNKKYKEFIIKRNFSKSSIIQFSKTNKINPGLLVGRLQNDKHIEWNQFNDLILKIR